MMYMMKSREKNSSGGWRWSLSVAAALVVAHLAQSQLAQNAAAIDVGGLEVTLTEVADGFMSNGQFAPTDASPLNDGSGRMLVSTLGGHVRLIDGSGPLDTASSPFLFNASFTGNPSGTGGWGNTGIAVHPEFASNGKFYTIETDVANSGATLDFLTNGTPQFAGAHEDVIVEWTWSNANTNAAPNLTRREVIRFEQVQASHNVVDLTFGVDGTDRQNLYLSSGDGGFHSNRLTNPQSLSSFNGKLFRINPLDPSGMTDQQLAAANLQRSANGKYAIPTDNPFFVDNNNDSIHDDPNTIPEIFAVGFRSPFRFNFDHDTGRLYLGDVGEAAREEIDLVVAGGNYGWGRFEGTTTQSGSVSLLAGTTHSPPVFEYGRSDGETVIGGFIYRGSALAELVGKYIFAEFGRGGGSDELARLFYGDVDPVTGDIIDNTVHEFMIDPNGELFFERDQQGNLIQRQFIFSIAEDAAGELYLLVGDDPQVGGAVNPDGRVLKIVPEPMSWILLSISLPMIAVRRRKRR